MKSVYLSARPNPCAFNSQRISPFHFSSLTAVFWALYLCNEMASGASVAVSPPRTPFLYSYIKARPIIADAIAAIGGAEALASLQTVEFKGHGPYDNVTQAFDNKSVKFGDLTAQTIIDYRDRLFLQNTLLDFRALQLQGTAIYREGISYSVNKVTQKYSTNKTDWATAIDRSERFLTPAVLQRLQKNIQSASWVGETVSEGHAADVIEFSWDETKRHRLEIDRTSHKIRTMRFLAADPIGTDEEVTISYVGEQRVAGLSFPHTVVNQAHARRYEIRLTDIKLNEPYDPAKFAVPAEYVLTPEETVTTKRVRDNLYEVGGFNDGHASQFLDRGDYVVVFDALGLKAARQVVEQIRKTVGSKPIKYLVLSHFHEDHASGLRAYVELGATIVTTKDNEDILTKYARAGSVLTGPPPQPTLQPKYLDVTGDRFEIPSPDGRSLVVYRISNIPHVKELLTLYDPATKSIINGDLYASFLEFNENYHRFADWLKSSKAPEVELILGTHHEPISKGAFLQEASRHPRSPEPSAKS